MPLVQQPPPPPPHNPDCGEVAPHGGKARVDSSSVCTERDSHLRHGIPLSEQMAAPLVSVVSGNFRDVPIFKTPAAAGPASINGPYSLPCPSQFLGRVGLSSPAVPHP